MMLVCEGKHRIAAALSTVGALAVSVMLAGAGQAAAGPDITPGPNTATPPNQPPQATVYGDIDPDKWPPGSGPLVVWWGQNYNGASISAKFNISDWWPIRYPHNGTGGGQRVGNNNGSCANYGGLATVRLFYDPGYSGPYHVLGQYKAGDWADNGADLGILLNNLRSSDFLYPI